ncbi:PP2C family protein-serine/threonine phosphatase [Streptacidiphilus sp. P02-A3a]|uniref:PP2C family protein-serine/threonine phosphatase n=1 Tax=Streptacidiphilus sp. P02-A3a TaxID=2704468 RepID=UPI0015FDC731|nr:SpoIIE family protein phosphatase [Streptacidiphilus sp. P02-A3a]QMU71810.1 SpoIIE family protein phosphatase [Streptacidiphilus sp. P02-A3a]
MTRFPPVDPQSLLSTSVSTEQDVFALRRHAKTIAAALSMDGRDQVRLATAVSELGRDLLRDAAALSATFTLLTRSSSVALRMRLEWTDDRTPSGESLTAVTRLLPQTTYRPGSAAPAPGSGAAAGSRIEIVCPVSGAPRSDAEGIRAALRETGPASALDDLRSQTGDLLAALQEAHAQRYEVERLNEELVETNAGVMAMYAELTVEHKDVVQRFGEEHEFALTLQRSFLPAALPTPPGVELAVRYLPAAAGNEIGGDFYEAVHTSQGLLLAVGDVVGHSLQAAMVMGELRHALRAYSAQGHPPHVLLQHLDHLMNLHQPGWTATLCIVLLEPGNSRIQVANAGHPPPLLTRRDGGSRFLREHGPLLGLNLPHPESTSHTVAPGDSLLMITDGLIETRGTNLHERLEELRAAADRGPAEPEALCDKLLEAFVQKPEDDIIVFAARLLPAETA